MPLKLNGSRESVVEGVSFTFHGLRKNSCCYLIECGLNDQQIGEMLGMSPEIVRHYGKRARPDGGPRCRGTKIGGKIISLPGANAPARHAKK